MDPRYRIKRYDDHLEVAILDPTGTEAGRFDCSIEDEALVLRHRWRLNDGGYVTAVTDGKTVAFHRAIFSMIPKGRSVDHIDRVRTNNRRTNLRLALPGMQSRNKLGRAEKTLPPGVSAYCDGGYEVQWTDDQTPTRIVFSAVRYGRRAALRGAMAARMHHLIVNTEYSEALFPTSAINDALKKVGAPLLDAMATAEMKRIALLALDKVGFNLWRLPYGGQFAKLVETGEWTVKDSKQYVIQMMHDTLIHLTETLDKAELKKECLNIECDVRALRFLYTTARRKEDDRRKKFDPILVPLFTRLDDGLSDLRSRVMPSHELKLSKKEERVPFDKAVELAKKEMTTERVDGAEKRRGEEAASEMATQTIGEMVAEILDKATELGERGKAKEVVAVLGAVMAKLLRVENPPVEDVEGEKEKRRYAVQPATTQWIAQHVHRREGAVTETSVVERMFIAWAKSSGISKPDGKMKIAQTMRDRGFESVPRRVYENCDLV
ncbi:MAG: HNH endonuclease signature motif containing protein [Candidatus Paceibacterota bacterium]